ncbi:hypothetical protein D3C84_1028880 [compost metagenome]
MLKTLTFTLMHFCIAFAVAYALTGSVTVGGLVATVEPLCNAVGFFFHDKLWQRLEQPAIAGSEPARQVWQNRSPECCREPIFGQAHDRMSVPLAHTRAGL